MDAPLRGEGDEVKVWIKVNVEMTRPTVEIELEIPDGLAGCSIEDAIEDAIDAAWDDGRIPDAAEAKARADDVRDWVRETKT